MLSEHQGFETRRIVTSATESDCCGEESGPIVALATDRGPLSEAKVISREARNLVEPAALARLRAFAWLSRDQVEGLARSLEAVKVRRGQRIFMEGEASENFYVLLSGVAKLSFLHREEKVLVGLVGPGEVFGVSSLLPNATRPFRCEAFSDCTVGVGKPSTFVGLTLGVPLERFSRTLEVTVGRWWTMLQRYTNFVGLTLRERLAGALLELAAKFGAEDARGVILTLKLTHADLAELVGASRQRTTEQLIDFENQRMIIRDGRRLIIVPDRLRGLAEMDEIRPVERAGGRLVLDNRRRAPGAG